MQNDNLKISKFIVKQFLCNVPVKEICWQDINDFNLEIQEELLKNTLRSELVLKYPINLNYQKVFLKSLLQYLEKQDSVIHDSLYEEYARLVALPNDNINFKHYAIEEKGRKNIILKEDICLISEGTTGLRTWQASLALCEWILLNTTHFKSKAVLELGSGIGLTGIVLSLHCEPQTVYLTDCHRSVLTGLCDNVILNLCGDLNKTYNIEKQFLLEERVNSCVVQVVNLLWEDTSSDFCHTLGHIDIIVAADVVYDETIFKPLIHTVDFLFKYCGVEEFILSCTERNSETLANFLTLLDKKYTILDITVPQQKNFLWTAIPQVKIFNISLC